MTTRSTHIKHVFNGGWATDLGARALVDPQNAQIPYLMAAENIRFRLDGSIQKAGGAAKINSSALEAGSDIRGVFDYWITGITGTSIQKRVVYVGTTIKKDDANGVFINIKTGLEANKNPSFNVLEDLLIIATDSTINVPMSWDGSTFQNLAGSPPNFSFAVTHEGRVWASGVPANPGRVYYSGYLAPTTWSGAGTGFIDIDPRDGDRITGLASYLGELWVFKGPYVGSIHRISGTAPTGPDSFQRHTFIKELGAVNHNGIFSFGTDLGFTWSNGLVYSIQTVERFGDVDTAALNRDIRQFISENVNFTALSSAQAAVNDDEGIALIALPGLGSTVPTIVITMDYRFNPPRWSNWTSFDQFCISLAQGIDPADNNRSIILAGGTDGFLRKLNQKLRVIDGTKAIAGRVATPAIDYLMPHRIKTLTMLGIAVAPQQATESLTFSWQRDNKSAQSLTITSLNEGGTLGSFVLDTSTLGGVGTIIDNYRELEEGGEFRSISYSLANTISNEHMNVQDFFTLIEIGPVATENL